MGALKISGQKPEKVVEIWGKIAYNISVD